MSTKKTISFRTVLSIVTFILIAVILYETRNSLVEAWHLLGRVNPWILIWVIPAVVTSYFATGGMIFSYLKQKKLIDHMSLPHMGRISLELNFVNHVLPSGGASGMAYFNWRLSKLGVSTARSTMAQAVRYIAGYIATTIMLLIGLFVVTIDGQVNRWIILMSAALIIGMIIGTFILYYIVSSADRIDKLAGWATRISNSVVRVATFGKKPEIVTYKRVYEFFEELHTDYVELSHEYRLLIKPIFWGFLYVTMDVLMFWITFKAFGTNVNPATILIGYQVAGAAGFLFATPGGVGAYEAAMVMIIVMSGVNHADALAGVLLSRVIILLVTIVGGYIFYQQSLMQYGKPKTNAANLQR